MSNAISNALRPSRLDPKARSAPMFHGPPADVSRVSERSSATLSRQSLRRHLHAAERGIGRNNGKVTRYVTDPRNGAPTQPNPTQPISIGCGWPFPFKVHAKSKTYVSRTTGAIGLGAAR